VRVKTEDGSYTLTDTYTDDVWGASSSVEEAGRRKGELAKVWDIKDVGDTHRLLGMRVEQNLEAGTITLSQRSYFEKVLADHDAATLLQTVQAFQQLPHTALPSSLLEVFGLARVLDFVGGESCVKEGGLDVDLLDVPSTSCGDVEYRAERLEARCG
jgi:hypothetical protein